jgi:hypothetical protein
MKGGSPEKDAIKGILGITRGTPDSYNPKNNLKEYYKKLLEIYNSYWREKDENSKQALTEEFTGKKSWSLFRSRGTGRQRVYQNLFSDLRLLDVMAAQLGRDPDLYDFSGKIFEKSFSGKIYSCVNFGFIPAYSLVNDLEKDTEEYLKQMLKTTRSPEEKERRERRERRERQQILDELIYSSDKHSKILNLSEPTGSDYQRNLLARIKQLEDKITEINAITNHPDHGRLDILKEVKSQLEEVKRQLEEESHLGKDMNKQPPSDLEGGTKSSRHHRGHRRGANKKSKKVHKSRKSRCSRR